MRKNLLLSLTIILTISITANFISCSKPNTDPPAVTCADKTIVITGTTTATSAPTATNGTITVSATGSTGFTYSLNGGSFQASGSFTNVAAGTYTITAKDDAGCTATKSFTVTATACPTITITHVLTQATSATSNNGAINATASGSTGITYSNGGAFQASGNFTGLTGNTPYTITAKDVNGCTSSINVTVTIVAAPTVTVTTTTTQTAGPTATNGSITCTGAGGTGPYTYKLDAGAFQAAGVNVFSNLLANTYNVVAKDANGILSASTPVVVSSACPTITIGTTIVGSELCAPANVGQITVNASGSTGFMYKIGTNAYQPSNIFPGLIAGPYTVSVRDANGCENTSNATVANLPQGPLFTSVKAVLAANCALSGCHAGASPQSGHNFADNCTIVIQKDRINARAVVAGTMPPTGAISAADKQKITDWINAGGKYSN